MRSARLLTIFLRERIKLGAVFFANPGASSRTPKVLIIVAQELD
jgi:hypothetical protein